MKIYGFGFQKRNVSSRVLYGLKGISKRSLLWGEVSINWYCETLTNDQPRYILGLGVYSGKDQDKIRIETKCSNRFRKRLIDEENYQEVDIHPFAGPVTNSKFAFGIGTYYCNMVSWKIVRLIEDRKLKSSYTFLHLPKRMSVDVCVDEIDKILERTTK